MTAELTMARRVAAPCLAALFLICGALTGATHVWSSGGPTSGRVSGLAVDPTVGTTEYATPNPFDGSGVFRSTDGGTTWSLAGPAGLDAGALAVGADHFVYAATGVGGLSVSGDNGATWSVLVPSAPSLYPAYVQFIKTDPINADILFVGRSGVGVGGASFGALSRSTDHGVTWVIVNSGISGGAVKALAIDRTDTSVLLAAADYGLFKSTNRGDTWVRLTGAPTGASLIDVGINPLNPAVVYVAAFGLGVFKSTDGGATFSAASAGLTDTRVGQILIDPARPATIYAASPSGVFRSVNSGADWAPFNTGLTNLNVRSLAVDLTGHFLHAATDTGVFDVLPDPNVLGLNPGQPFSATLSARDQRTGRTATGIALPQGALFGFFSLPDFTGNSANPEVFLKILDGRSINGKFWIFYGGLTDLEYTLTVSDDSTGKTKTYTKPAGSASGGFDTSAFP